MAGAPEQSSWLPRGGLCCCQGSTGAAENCDELEEGISAAPFCSTLAGLLVIYLFFIPQL